MKRFQVIVIDDQVIGREGRYSEFAARISEVVPGFVIDLEFVRDPGQLAVQLRSKVYAAAIVDAVLDEFWPPEFSLRTVLRMLGSMTPVALVSSQWDNTNSEDLNYAWEQPNCRTFLHWRDIDGSSAGSIKYAIAQFTGMIADAQGLHVMLSIKPGESLRIVHISDLQAGGFADESAKLEANSIIDLIHEELDFSEPTFLAFTGDIAERGRPTEYKKALAWLQTLCEGLGLGGLPSDRVFVVPGNHDVSIPICGASRIALEKVEVPGGRRIEQLTFKDAVISEELLDCAFDPYMGFARKASRASDRPALIKGNSLPWVETGFRQLGVVFYGLNTAQAVNAFGVPARRVQADALSAVGSALGPFVPKGSTEVMCIGMGHHCPSSAHSDRGVENPEVFGKFFGTRVRTGLFLHGHVHRHAIEYSSESGVRLVRSCASTLSKESGSRPAESLRGFNLVTLNRKENRVSAMEAKAYGWVGETIALLDERTFNFEEDGMFTEVLKANKKRK